MPYQKLRAGALIHDVHDIFLYPELGNKLTNPPIKPLGPKASAKLVARKFSKVMVRSQYHADRLKLAKYNRSVVVIKNGVRIQAVRCDGRVKRERLRFIYTSDYSRGLVQLLKWFWPELKKLVPEVELHVFYGMSGHTPQFQSRMSKLFRQDSVINHGRQDISVLTAARCRSSFHLYFSRTNEETDCISIREVQTQTTQNNLPERSTSALRFLTPAFQRCVLYPDCPRSSFSLPPLILLPAAAVDPSRAVCGGRGDSNPLDVWHFRRTAGPAR